MNWQNFFWGWLTHTAKSFASALGRIYIDEKDLLPVWSTRLSFVLQSPQAYLLITQPYFIYTQKKIIHDIR